MADPKFFDDNPTTILNDILTDFGAIMGKSIQMAQPEGLFCAAVAYRVQLERARMNATFKNMLLPYATGTALDYIVALVGITRLISQKALTTIQFTLVPGHGDIVIPAGTRIKSTDGQVVFETLLDISVLSAVNTADADVICQNAGKAGNNYAIGTITEIMDPQAYLSAASNISKTYGGSDAETDDQLRERAFNAPSQFSVAGSRDAYKFHTFSVSPLIIDVAVLTHSEDNTIPYGHINIYPLLSGGIVADNALVNAIEAKLTDDKIKPLNDIPVVLAPTQVQFDLTINITKLVGSSSVEIIDQITAVLDEFRQQKIIQLGIDIINSEIVKICRVNGVYDLGVTITPVGKVLTGDNLVIAGNEFALLSDYTINITGTNNG